MTALVASACGLLAACSHSSSSGGGAFIKRHATGSGASPANADDPGPTDLVSAVSGGAGGDGPVALKFQVAQRPQSGMPVVVTLRLVANQPLQHLEARFHADEGMDVTQGGDFAPEGPMEAGSVLDHTLTLVPARDGIYTVMATVTTGSAAEAVSRSFVIPIVVSPQVPAAAVVPAEAAKRK